MPRLFCIYDAAKQDPPSTDRSLPGVMLLPETIRVLLRWDGTIIQSNPEALGSAGSHFRWTEIVVLKLYRRETLD